MKNAEKEKKEKKETRKALRDILRQEKGMALMLVLCLFALLMGLGASAFFAAATGAKSAGRQLYAEQAHLSAQSAADVLSAEITSDSPTDLKNSLKDLESTGSNSFIKFTSTLPGTMGTIEGTFTREGEDYGVLKITASQNEEAYTMELVFARIDNSSEPEGSKDPEWIFSGYRTQ